MFHKQYLIDSLATAIFWSAIYIPFNHYVWGLSWEATLGISGTGSLLMFAFGGVFGWFLDKWRKKLV